MTLNQKTGESKKERDTRLSILKRTLELITTALALVAGLAWNDAIQSIFKEIFGPQSTMIAKLLYAMLITTIVVVIGFRISKIQKHIDEKLVK